MRKTFKRLLTTFSFIFFALLFVGGISGNCFAELQPVFLHCEYHVNPLGIDEVQPRLTWQVQSNERGQKQIAYQILVASRAELLRTNTGDLWDSGKVIGDQTVNI